MSATEIVKQLKSLGKASYKHVLRNHGIPEPFFGVSVAELKRIQGKVKKDYKLALELYDTGIYDARYLAGLIADEAKMTKKDLNNWATKANCSALSGYTVAWVAGESEHALELALKWIDSKNEGVATSGWATLSSHVSVTADADLDLAEFKKLLQRVEKTIGTQPNQVRSAMNRFVIAVGCYVKPLSALAIATGERIGPVKLVTVGACKVPYSPEYIKKVQKRGTIGKKRKTARC